MQSRKLAARFVILQMHLMVSRDVNAPSTQSPWERLPLPIKGPHAPHSDT